MNKFLCLRKWIALAAALLFGLSCTAQHSKDRVQNWAETGHVKQSSQLFREQSWILPRNTKIYISYEQPVLDKQLTTVVYNRLNERLISKLSLALQSHFAHVVVGGEDEQDQLALIRANAQGCDLWMKVSLVDVVDHLSSVVEIDRDYDTMSLYAQRRADPNRQIGLDRLTVGIRLTDVRTGSMMDFVTIKTYSGWAQYHSHQPERLVDNTVQTFAKAFTVGRMF